MRQFAVISAVALLIAGLMAACNPRDSSGSGAPGAPGGATGSGGSTTSPGGAMPMPPASAASQ